MGQQFSAKDFRTWRCNVIFLEKLISRSNTSKELTLKSILEDVAEVTGNTPSILQSSYIHPALIELAKNNNVKQLRKSKIQNSALGKYETILHEFLSIQLN